AKVWAHAAFADRCREDDADALFDVSIAARHLEPAAAVEAERECPPRADEVDRVSVAAAIAVVDGHIRDYPPIMTVGAPGPTMAPVPGGTLVLHVDTVSPILAAGLPPIKTVALPLMTRPS